MAKSERSTLTRREKRVSAADKKALPILRNVEDEKRLIEHCLARVRLSNIERSRRADRCHEIDMQVSGFSKLDKEDKKRAKDNKAGKKPRPVHHNLPLTQAQLDEAETYLMGIYAPDMDIFEAVAPAKKQPFAKALTAEINKNGQRGQYFRMLSRFCKNAMKYNFGAITCYWEEFDGVVFKKSGNAGQIQRERGVAWEGNVIECANTYNFFYDTSVHPVDLPIMGEYFATVERVTPFKVQRDAEQGKLFAVERYAKETVKNKLTTDGDNEKGIFYRQPPIVRDDFDGEYRTNWRDIVTAGEAQESVPGIELLRFTAWIVPKDFGLSPDKELQLWRIVIANGKWLTFAKQLEDTHGMLPVAIAAPIEDDLGNDQRTYAEQLIPLQHFASFLLNSHQEATRKAIYGITVFNQHLIPGLDMTNDDLIGARVAIRSSATDFDIDKAFRHYSQAPTTDRNVDMIAKVEAIMQKILPTDRVRQVADLERATKYQAAATVQAGDSRNLKIARMISDQALQLLKLMMVYNIYANVEQITYIDDTQGEELNVSPAQLVEAGIENYIGTGLKGIDRLIHLEVMRDLFFAVLQSQEATQQTDVMGFLNYLSSVAGEHTDLTVFRRQIPAAPAAGITPAEGTESESA